MNPTNLQARLTEALDNVAAAEREVEAALAALTSGARSDKQIVSERLSVAFEKLSAARKVLEAARAALA